MMLLHRYFPCTIKRMSIITVLIIYQLDAIQLHVKYSYLRGSLCYFWNRTQQCQEPDQFLLHFKTSLGVWKNYYLIIGRAFSRAVETKTAQGLTKSRPLTRSFYLFSYWVSWGDGISITEKNEGVNDSKKYSKESQFPHLEHFVKVNNFLVKQPSNSRLTLSLHEKLIDAWRCLLKDEGPLKVSLP